MNAEYACRLIADVLQVEPGVAVHQSFGHCSVTYDVALPDGNVIVRMNENPQVFAGTERNIAILSGLGLPVPRVLASDLTARHVPFAYLILEKIPGRDLGFELATMSEAQQTRLAEQIVSFQQKVMQLPPGAGYGYVSIGEKGAFDSWWELLGQDRNDPLRANLQTPIPDLASRVREQWVRFEPYLRQVPPTCFLDDLTVKNVLIQNGELRGVVDFDCVCYGDPLYMIGLAAAGVVSDVGTRELFYIEELCRCWNLNAEQWQVAVFYSLQHALWFVGRFHAEQTPEWNARMIAALEQWLSLLETTAEHPVSLAF